MVNFGTFYQMAAGSHKGRYELDKDKQLVFGKNLAVERSPAGVYDLLLRAILEDPVASAHPDVKKVTNEIDVMKAFSSPVDAQDVRKWQRELQMDISFGHKCIADIPVAKNPPGAVGGKNAHLQAGMEALDNDDTVVGSKNASEAARYFEIKLEEAHESFSAYFDTVPDADRERSDLLTALSGRLIAGCRLSRPAAELRSDYTQLMSILTECKKESGDLPLAQLGLASEAIDVYVARADADGLLAKKRLVLEARADAGLRKTGNSELNPQLYYSHLRDCLDKRPRVEGRQARNMLYRGLAHVGEDTGGYFNLLVEQQRGGVIGRLERFFNWVIRRDIRKKDQVTEQLRELCLQSERFDKDFVKEFWNERGNVPAGRRQWTLADVDNMVNRLETAARENQKIKKGVDGSAERRAFPLEKSPESAGFSISELLAQGYEQEGEAVVGNGNKISAEHSLYTIGDTTLLLTDADLQEIDRRVQNFIREKQETSDGLRPGVTQDQLEAQRIPGQQLHKLRALYGADVLKICHSYALEKLYNRWFFDDRMIRGLLSEKNADGSVKNENPAVLLPDGMEYCPLEEPYYGELLGILRERLSESGAKVCDVLEKTSPPYRLSEIFHDKYTEIIPREEWQPAVEEAMSRVGRMAFVQHAIENPIENRTEQLGRLGQYCQLLPAHVQGEDLEAMLTKPEFAEAMNNLYNVSKPLSARMNSLTYLQRSANFLAHNNNEIPQEGQQKWQWQDYLSVFKEAWQLNKTSESSDLEELAAMDGVGPGETIESQGLFFDQVWQSSGVTAQKEKDAEELALDPSSLENDLAALKEFLRLPEEFTGEVQEANRLVFESCVEAGDILLPAHHNAGELFQNVPAAAGDARVRELNGVAEFYAQHSDYREAATQDQEPGLQLFPDFSEGLKNRQPVLNLFGVEGDRVRLHGNSPKVLAWESVDDLVSRVARDNVMFFLEEGLGARVEADEVAIDRQVQLLKSFITKKGLKDEIYTQQDIQQQLQRQVGVIPRETTSQPPVPVPVLSLEEFEQKHYLPVLEHHRKASHKDSRASKLRYSDQEMKLCFSRVLPLAVASYNLDVERFSTERDPGDLDERIRSMVAEVIQGRDDLEDARTDL